MSDSVLPLAGVKVVEFTHMVMGPTCGLILGDLGADVIKVEPLKGDNTRNLKGSGAGFFPAFNRNKQSIALDLHHPDGMAIALRLVESADIVSENFKASTMQRLGLDYASLSSRHPRLIYVSHKGFLPGPYEKRTALDEVVQMMGGLAYMTGPEGRPLRAGSSVNDIMGGMFGALGAIAALRERDRSGRGQHIQSALFENNIFLVAQHMLQYEVTGKPAAPMPSRISAWGIYDVFSVRGGEQIFLAVVSDTQWGIFCDAFGFDDLKAEARYETNNQRVEARDTLLPELRHRLAAMSAGAIAEVFERHGLPFAPIARPHELLDDPHLNGSGGLADIRLDGEAGSGRVPLLPIALDGERPGLRLHPPRRGEHTASILASLGYTPEQVEDLARRSIVASSPETN
ncbi:Formyl-coenzyme A transferase [Pigmentiphaga humi]|uniref:Formyl-coenzyme A transferase n=1 Tax=Pigmentiphaga humi TaxID=2478468 RepID=A0A3P4B026_9BURK|nr:CaiB/BaiF CoA-transferase family protein [Pigmentiphaga humi]VCU69392.1 Formyl-coenzyme A transferase [Pigmentiphaga humi]